jgi:hypothetical protein
MNDAGFNDGPGNYPGAVSYFEQRRVFGGTLNRPQNFWGTKSGTESNMSYSIPTRDDNRVAFRIAAREASAVRHIVPVTSLVLLTPSCEYRVNPNGEVLTPSSISVKPQSYIGCNNVTPVLVGNSILFAQARGGRIREMSYSWQAGGYLTNDISILAPHLFDYQNITDMAFCRAPYPVLWAVSSSGQLLGMTYVPEQQIAAWHRHDTAGGVVRIGVRGHRDPGGQVSAEDMLYVIVKRTIGGGEALCRAYAHPQFRHAGRRVLRRLRRHLQRRGRLPRQRADWLEGETVAISGRRRCAAAPDRHGRRDHAGQPGQHRTGGPADRGRRPDPAGDAAGAGRRGRHRQAEERQQGLAAGEPLERHLRRPVL